MSVVHTRWNAVKLDMGWYNPCDMKANGCMSTFIVGDCILPQRFDWSHLWIIRL